MVAVGRRDTDEHGREYWSARELREPLGYSRWQKFNDVIGRAYQAATNALGETAAQDQFTLAGKSIVSGKGGIREITDWHLTRYAAYLVAMNGDPIKPEIAP